MFTQLILFVSRMVPAYFVLWLYQISWSDRLGNGPFEYRITGVERQMCKINGWSNFLFINNYFNWDKGVSDASSSNCKLVNCFGNLILVHATIVVHGS